MNTRGLIRHPVFILWIACAIFPLLLSACQPMIAPTTLPSVQPTATLLPIQPPVATQTPPPATATRAPIPTNTAMPTLAPTTTPTSVYTATLAPTFTPTSAPTLTPTPRVVPCNQAEFVADVTIPDGTLIDAGVTFTKTWRLRNIGTCTWTPDYRVVFMSGDQLGGPDYILLGTSIIPGQTIDISLVLTAPETSGAYKGSYKLADARGTSFGLGTSANNPFFVSIQQGTPPAPPYAFARLSTARVEAGKELTVYVSGFPAGAEIDYRVGKLNQEYAQVYDGTVGADGTTRQTITIPANAVSGEYWVVQVLTTSLRDVIKVSSHSIYITRSYVPPYSGDLQVSLSSTEAHAGDQVTVYVRGFPANAEIDLRVGEQGKVHSVVVDGTVGSNGTTIETFTIPSGAVKGQYWVVKVTTTNLQNVVTATSHPIYINR